MKKHLATYAEYGPSGKRVATGFLYSADEIASMRDRFEKAGLPFHFRWRNEICRSLAISSQDRA